jgi:hypothetical protein
MSFILFTPPFTEDGILTARLSPFLASQVAAVGLMLRTDETANAPMVALSVSASSGGERPQWIVSLLSREKAGEAFRMVNALPLDGPIVAWGRIVDSIWLRLSRDHGELRALLSKDGLTGMNA